MKCSMHLILHSMKLIDEITSRCSCSTMPYNGAGTISLQDGLYGQMVDETDGRCVS